MEPIELRCRREALGLTQQELADILPVSQSAVAHWENGRRNIPDGLDGDIAALERDREALIRQFERDVEAQLFDAERDTAATITLTTEQATDPMTRMAAALTLGRLTVWHEIRIVVAD